MSRVIKFRAFTKKWGMVYPEDKGKSIDIHARIIWEDCREEENVQLMQFTGLFDEDGKEIYEGDLVEFTAIKHHGDNFVGEIFYDEEDAAFYHTFEEGRPSKRFFNSPHWKLKIIGNIFEE